MGGLSFFRTFLQICFLLLIGVANVCSFSYIDSLSAPQSTPPLIVGKTAGSYLDTLQQSTTSTATDWSDTIAETPDDHYAKHHPGAGWAGYKDPMYGGYLDHLSSNNDSTNNCVIEAGKKPDYGDDIRWGAQVYLDNLQ